jgi:folate-dependent phosphoribosylglycinamide formyltransferase PurN
MTAKIVCFIKESPPLIYFTNKINSVFPLAEVIIEKPEISRKKIISRIRKDGILDFGLQVADRLWAKNRYVDDYKEFFGDMWTKPDERLSVFRTSSINSEEVYERMQRIKPDIIIDHGTSIVKDHILDTSSLALNLHWGLSPYYRGTHCSEWALINWDPYNIGVTIHKLTREIDGGNVLAQKRIDVEPDDTLNRINMKLTLHGTELMMMGISKFVNKEPMEFRKQDFSMGYLAYQRQWGVHLKRHVEYIEQQGMVRQMLKYPARKEKMPIIEMT